MKYQITFGITLAAAILRNPFVSVFTHNVNQSNKRMTTIELREANLAKVLDEANERQAKLAMNRQLTAE